MDPNQIEKTYVQNFKKQQEQFQDTNMGTDSKMAFRDFQVQTIPQYSQNDQYQQIPNISQNDQYQQIPNISQNNQYQQMSNISSVGGLQYRNQVSFQNSLNEHFQQQYENFQQQYESFKQTELQTMVPVQNNNNNNNNIQNINLEIQQKQKMVRKYNQQQQIQFPANIGKSDDIQHIFESVENLGQIQKQIKNNDDKYVLLAQRVSE
eukprot:TRINITY_DN6958_c0_g1_i1.p1 TRINITY_DN6958_c0_g1~~TRINITY_DN6958_c0_g1_i1.p1  ORF type:complete len:207 (-),score=21.37 TRINITY_DN6958_c0_g1_i1:51-671(-)